MFQKNVVSLPPNLESKRLCGVETRVLSQAIQRNI